MTKTRFCAFIAIMAGVILHLPLTARAATLDEAIVSLAENLSGYLEENGQTKILIGNFEGPGTATAGRAIRSALKNELTKRNTQIVPLGAHWTARGQFSFEPSGSAAIVLVKTELFDSSGKEIVGFRQKVKVEEVSSIEDISRLLGLTVDLVAEQEAVASPSDIQFGENKRDIAERLISTQAKLTDKLVSSISQPVFVFRNDPKTEVAADNDSKFRVEVLVLSENGNFQPLEISDTGGFPFAPLQANDTYRIQVHNDADHAVGAKISIDGINSFALSEEPAYREMGVWFIGARSTGVIPGWYVNQHLAKAFLVTAQGDALGLPDASDIGTVTVQFFHAWREGESPPAVEKLAANRGQLRTGVGRDISRDGGFTKSFFGQSLLTSISIRYSNPEEPSAFE